MVVSVTLGFMLSTFVKQSEGFQKKRPINIVNVLGVFVYVCLGLCIFGC